MNLLAPMAIEQMVAIEADDLSGQLAEGAIRLGADGAENPAKMIWELSRS